MKKAGLLLSAILLILFLAACASEEPTAAPPTAVPTVAPTATPVPEPTATPVPPPTAVPTATPAPTPVPQPTATPIPVPTPTPRPLVATEAVLNEAHDRLSVGRIAAGLDPFIRAEAGSRDFVEIFRWVIGCYETVDQHYDLMWPDIHAVSLKALEGGSECAMEVATYHYVPDTEKMRVSNELWECFSDSADIRDPNPESCGGRYSFITGHVKWLPSEVYFLVLEGEQHATSAASLIPWMQEKLGITAQLASSLEEANLFLHFGGALPEGCGEAAGCNVLQETATGWQASIYVNTAPEYFLQVLKHELLHALLPMGHLPPGNYLMSARVHDPDQTQELSQWEEELLRLYTHPYLRDGITMERFRNYLIVE